jgi:hypothetical protein
LVHKHKINAAIASPLPASALQNNMPMDSTFHKTLVANKRTKGTTESSAIIISVPLNHSIHIPPLIIASPASAAPTSILTLSFAYSTLVATNKKEKTVGFFNIPNFLLI